MLIGKTASGKGIAAPPSLPAYVLSRMRPDADVLVVLVMWPGFVELSDLLSDEWADPTAEDWAVWLKVFKQLRGAGVIFDEQMIAAAGQVEKALTNSDLDVDEDGYDQFLKPAVGGAK